ncbi:hypothetical protein OCC_01149 [Thermococcus litoralis DSM 5473]|uniref:DUF835 domain-containing protein n=1 Tax=Thermococcus litoralis (strain ATCC 51850 / DSM 5473 / JCM 8560 / NS-C) TaxID=523849 RepID=H3ZLU1_THELN|nr:DUF835 domain-containing protein [Thermococcus litoralis]EHR79093.1 hypothetical protein OCC_01149 [Thermococcus litoralis DSM 5473]
MPVGDAIGMICGMVVILFDLMAFLLILRVYFKTKRKSALFISLAWLFDLFTVLHYSFLSLGYTVSVVYRLGILLNTVAALMFVGIVKWLEEEKIEIAPHYVEVFSLLGPIVVLYLVAVGTLMEAKAQDLRGFLVLSSFHGIAGLLFMWLGYLVREIKDIYGKKITYLSVVLFIFGLHLLPIPVTYALPEQAIFGSAVSAFLIVTLTVLMIRLTSSEEFLRLKTMEIHEVEIEPGVRIINQEEYKKVKEKLKDVPVLAFVRALNNIPENWTSYFVTTATKESKVEAISPMNLERMTELSYKYLKAMEEAGSRGIILIDCLEYLIMYNEFTSVIKFLNKLKDFVVSHKGTLLLVAERDAFEDQQWALLTRLLEEAKE